MHCIFGSCNLLFYCCIVYYTECNSFRKRHGASPQHVNLVTNVWKFVTRVKQTGGIAKVSRNYHFHFPENKPSNSKIS